MFDSFKHWGYVCILFCLLFWNSVANFKLYTIYLSTLFIKMMIDIIGFFFFVFVYYCLFIFPWILLKWSGIILLSQMNKIFMPISCIYLFLFLHSQASQKMNSSSILKFYAFLLTNPLVLNVSVICLYNEYWTIQK